MSLLLGALTLGFIFSLIALGVFISFRIFAFPDITADGSSTLGAALAAMLVGTRQLGLSITGAVMGSVLFRLLVAIALRLGLNPNDLKLVTALFVFLALITPGLLKRLNLRKPRSSHA